MINRYFHREQCGERVVNVTVTDAETGEEEQKEDAGDEGEDAQEAETEVEKPESAAPAP